MHHRGSPRSKSCRKPSTTTLATLPMRPLSSGTRRSAVGKRWSTVPLGTGGTSKQAERLELRRKLLNRLKDVGAESNLPRGFDVLGKVVEKGRARRRGARSAQRFLIDRPIPLPQTELVRQHEAIEAAQNGQLAPQVLHVDGVGVREQEKLDSAQERLDPREDCLVDGEVGVPCPLELLPVHLHLQSPADFPAYALCVE